MKEIFDSIQSRKQKKILLKVRAGAKQSSVDGWIIINDKEYLFNKLKIILDEKNIDFNLFCKVYDEVSLTSAP